MDYMILSLVAILFAARDLIDEGEFLLGWQKLDSNDFPLWKQLLWPFRDGWHGTNWVGLALLVVVWPLVATISVMSTIWYAVVYAVVFEVSHTWLLRRPYSEIAEKYIIRKLRKFCKKHGETVYYSLRDGGGTFMVKGSQSTKHALQDLVFFDINKKYGDDYTTYYVKNPDDDFKYTHAITNDGTMFDFIPEEGK